MKSEGAGGETRNFRMKILRQGNTMNAYFVAGGASDGLPGIEGETAGLETSQTEGVIPIGEHQATVNANTTANFKITSPQLPMSPESGGILGTVSGLQRLLTFTADPPLEGHIIDPRVIAGSFTEAISMAGKPASHLDRTTTGAFAIVAAIPASPEQ